MEKQAVTFLPNSSRRGFVAHLGRIASLGALGSLVATSSAGAEPDTSDEHAPGDWDLSWLDRLKGATDRAVVDWHAKETPPESTPLDYAARYLDGCIAAYGSANTARAVVVIRHEATPAALSDAAWKRYEIGAVEKVDDPTTKQPAVRNPFWSNPSRDKDAPPDLQGLVGRGVIVLACNLALTHLSERIARAHGEDPAAVHSALRGSLVPNAYAVPSGVGCGASPARRMRGARSCARSAERHALRSGSARSSARNAVADALAGRPASAISLRGRRMTRSRTLTSTTRSSSS